MTSLASIKARAESMEAEKRVDLGIVGELKQLKEDMIRVKTTWENSSHGNGFYLYQVARSAEFIIDKAIQRFKNAHAGHDNPQIALDVLKVLPTIGNAVAMANTTTPESHTDDEILECVRQLIDMAAETNLLNEKSSDVSNIDPELLGKIYDNMMQNIGIPFELPSIDDDNTN